MVAEKGRKATNASQDFLKVIKSNGANVSYKDGKAQVVTQENIAKFVRGEMTWAQVQGVSMEQAYAFAELGYNLFMQGRYEDARKIFDGLVVLNPYDGYFHSVLGSIFARQNKVEDAFREYSIAVNLEPRDPQVFVNRAELLLKKGKFEEALGDLKQAVLLDPEGNNPAVTRARALAAATLGLINEILKSKQAEEASVKPAKVKPKK
jgi:Flp pilus assembly protein TadD